ncbi:kelch-like protein 10 [Neocloeon triangulifer]|uniref:kelch-like protein 10 n=1 Tax=Neocloeon triangulifer TaxID=2078957 RepID=UPI00286F7500|nr:kelch-like protein 10 [Neocloeon triangulifer]
MPNSCAYLQFIDDLRENETLCNATVVSKDGTPFRVHSAVLMACSEFFKAAFEFGPREGTKGVEKSVVRLPTISSDILSSIVRYAYLKAITLTCANVWKTLLAADFLQVGQLSRMCCEFMKENLTLPKCTKIIEMTQGSIYMPAVHDMATKFALHNLCKPSYKVRNQQRAALEQLKPETLRALLKDNVLNAPREQYVWETVVEWLESSPEQRTQYLDQVLELIRIGLMPKSYVSHNVLGHPAVQSRPDLVRQVQDLELAVDQLLAEEITEGTEILVAVQPRLPHTVVLSVGGWVNGAPSLEMQLYDINADAWIEVDVLESRNPEYTMAYHGLARLGDDLYVIGGTESGTDTTRCLKLNLQTFQWELVASLTQSRDFVSVVALNDRIYAIGGRSYPQHPRNYSGEFYDPQTNAWHPIAPMHHCRSDAGCTVYAGKIYVVGGFTGETVLSSSEVYDPLLNTWELLPEMITPRSGVRCVTLRKHIYAIGGFSGSVRLASMERLDPERLIWIPMEPMLTPRSNLGAAVVGDEILAIGGYNGRSVDNSNEVYNVFEDKWYSLAPLPSPRSALNVVSIEDSFEMALRLMGPNRDLPKLICRDRDAHRPEYGSRLAPHAELPAGQPPSYSELSDELDSDWQEVADPFGLALILPADDEGGVWGPLRFFVDQVQDVEMMDIDGEDQEWEDGADDGEDEFEDDDDEDQGDDF